MRTRHNSSGNGWGFLLVVGALALCCGGHVLVAVGGLAALSGIFAGLPWWLVALGVVTGGIGIWLYRSRRQSSCALKAFREMDTG